jgi:hypothetical protein
MARFRVDCVLGALACGLGLVAVLLWVPADTGTGIVEKVRGSYLIGDAMAPTLAFSLLVLAGVILMIESSYKSSAATLSWNNLSYLLIALAICAVSLLMMRWAGPLATWLVGQLSGEDLSYRLLRDEVPWKYIGYLLGGTLMVSGFIFLMDKKASVYALGVGLLCSVAMIAFYDLPFDNLLLPPNGDL